MTLLHKFAEAYNRHDVDAIMSFMTDDCIFISYFGPDPEGERYSGIQSVRARVAAGLADFPDARWEVLGHLVSGNRGVSEWIFRGTKKGTVNLIERYGVDLFTFQNDKIRLKNTFHKWTQPK
mgnify:CR=1 FL=1